MSKKSTEDDLRDSLYRLKLRQLSANMWENQFPQTNDEMKMIPVFSEQQDRISQLDNELKEARRKMEKLQSKFQYQEMEKKIISAANRENEKSTKPQPDERFSQFLEMMALQHTQNQNLMMNHIILKNRQDTSQIHHHSYFNNQLPNQLPDPVPALPTAMNTKMHSDKVSQPYPGNEAQQTMRQMGLAALFCSSIESDYDERSLTITDKFLFEVKIQEILVTIEKYYINPAGDIYRLLNSLLTPQSPDLKILLTKTGTNEELIFAEKELSTVLQGVVEKLTEIMPTSGTLGSDCKSILSEYLQNNQTFPNSFFLTVELDLLKLDSNNTIHNVGFSESQLLLIGVFVVRTMVMHILLKSGEYKLSSSLSTIGSDNLRILASLLMTVYMSILSDFVAQRFPNESKKLNYSTMTFVELDDLLVKNTDLQPLVKSIKKVIDYSKTTILNWSQTYVMKLRPL